MTGTFINVGAVIAGTALGLAVGPRLPAKVRATAVSGLGLAVLAIGIGMAAQTRSVLVVVASVLIGGVVGSLCDLDGWFERLGQSAEAWLMRHTPGPVEPGTLDWRANVSRSFVSSSLIFCVGPLTITGSIQDGMTGDYSLLAVKSLLDGVFSVAFASTMGAGVLLSTFTILIYQGALTLGAGSIRGLLTDGAVRELTGTGGLLVIGLGLQLLEIKRLPVGNLLPALAVAPIAVLLADRFL